MWYKTAKQGSVWSRLGPDAEAQFDELIKQATKRHGDKKRYVDVVLFDKLFRKSNFKNLVLRFILREKFREDASGYFQVSLFDKIEKLAFLDKFIPTIFANNISINKAVFNGELSYYAQISLLKHEFAHAITSHTIENRKNELYVQPLKYTKSLIGKTPLQTYQLQLKKKLKDNWSEIWPYVSKADPNFEFTLFDDKMPLDENLQKIENSWNTFIKKVKDYKIIIPIKLYKIIGNINSGIWDIISGYPQEDQKVIDLLRKRSETLGSDDVDLYYANPEETRAHIVEMQHLFSIPLLKEYYEHLLILKKYNKENSKQEFLEDIKKMINILMGTTYNDLNSDADWVSENYSPIKYASYFGLNDTYYKFLYKANDQKFRQQVAKHLNNVYQELKQEFNNTEPEND